VTGYLFYVRNSFYILIQISTANADSISEADKKPLSDILATVGNDTTEYYTSSDRWNGSLYDERGHWNAFIEENGPRSQAQGVLNAPRSKEQIDSTVIMLSSAIAKLIPTSRINATDLYELSHERLAWKTDNTLYTVTTATTNMPLVSADNTTASSWEAYDSARARAETLLGLLYENESPTEYNSTLEGTAKDDVAAAVSALRTARNGLEKIANEYDLQDAQMAYDSIPALANRVFNPATQEGSEYTSESWAAYLEVRATALAFYESHDRPAQGIGVREAAACVKAYTDLWNACYLDLRAQNGGTATIHFTDSVPVHTGGTPAAYHAGVREVTVPAGGITIDAALVSILNEGYELYDAGVGSAGIGVYLNGVYLFNLTENAAGGAPASQGYENVRLKPGDTLVVAAMQQPTESNMSGGTNPLPALEALPDVQFLRLTQNGNPVTTLEAAAGEDFTLEVGYRFALPAGYNGVFLPKSGVKVYISEACSSEEAARTARTDVDTGVVADDNGMFTLRLVSPVGSAEGWYLLNVYDASEKGGLANGANLLIHVTDGELAAFKTRFKEELSTLYAAYDSDFYTAEQLTRVESLYTGGIEAIEAAATSGAAAEAYESARQAISDIQQSNLNQANLNLAYIVGLLEWLPRQEALEAGKLYASDKPYLDALFGESGVYPGMSNYQRGLLSVEEIERLEALEQAYLASDRGSSLDPAPLIAVDVEIYDAESGQQLDLEFDAWHFQHVVNNTIELRDGDIIGIDSMRLNANRGDAIPAGASFNIGGSLTGYETVRVETSFSDEETQGWNFYNRYGVTTDAAPGFRITNARLRSGGTIKLYVKSAAEDPAAAWIAQLDAALGSYDRSAYSTENWTLLLDAYFRGTVNIRNAGNDSERDSALEQAVSDMNSIPSLGAVPAEPIQGWGQQDEFDAGEKVGTVTVLVQNNTFDGTPFRGDIVTRTSFALGKNDSMMTVALRALAEAGFTWTGTGGNAYGISYLSSIEKDGEKLGEFSGSNASGWMGTLNDWFVDESLSAFTVNNGKLHSGDVVTILYTQALGTDVGGTWNNSNTSLRELEISGGRLLPGYVSDTLTYALLIDGSRGSIRVTPTAANKNYLVKTFLNEKVTTNDEGNSFYRRTETIPVRTGDVVYIGVGERAWPSMNKTGAEARAYEPTWYAIHVITADNGADYVNELIAALPAAKNINTSNYKAVQNQIDAIDAVIAVLSASEQAKVNTATLEAVREIANGYESVMALKAEIAALPASITEADREAVEAAKAHYDALTAAQKNLLTVAETNKLLKAVNTLAVLDALAAIDGTKNFASTEANTQTAVETALKAWANAAVAVDSFTAAVDGTAENLKGTPGSYTATVTVTIDSGAVAASGEKPVTGSITPVAYVKSSNAGVQSIKVNGVTATGSGTAYAATLPYGSDRATASFEIVPADKATASVPETSDGGATWTFTVTAEDGTTAEYNVTLSVNSVVVTVHECGVYTVTSDVTVTELSPAAVSGLLEAVSTDALELPQGTETVALWLSVTATAKDSEDITLRIEPIYAVDGAEGEAVPATALIGQITVTLPIPGTEYSKVLAAGEYLDAEGAESGITFMITAAGEYTLIPDAHIANVTWHLNGGTSADVTDGQQTIYFRSDAGSDLPEAEKSGYTFKGWHSENSIDSVAYIAVSAQLPADLYAVWQSQNVNAAVTVSGVSAVKSGSVFTVTLPYGSAYPKAADISITPEDAAATYTKPMTGDDGASWSFTVTAEDGTRQEYTLQVMIAEQTAEDILTAAKQAIEGADWNTEQTTANSEETLKTFVEGKLAALDLGAAYTVNVTSVTPAVAGNAENTQGTAGSYSFTVTLTSGEDSATATGSGSISATAYVAPAQAADYVPALNAVLPYLRDEVTDPDVGSTYGEWAVFALNRGGAATEVWNNIYLSNLKTYVDECGGKLAEKNYTEYSRVILALTSMGVDASSFSTDKATYDLVKPLLDKQTDGAYWAEWQGNNGTCFALLAVDSHGYLDTAEGKALRSGLIASLKAHQQASGAWAIEGFGTPDLDVTAAAIYALAPYYLDEAKLSALGGSVSYAEVKGMVENALAYLSNAQNTSGGFGSVEADVWAIIALSSIGRDADTDADFVKNGKSLLADMLSYRDETTGAFRHLLSGSVDQMATEQSAYGLVAYDRFKNNKNALYDMSDVSFDSGEQSQAEKDKALAESVDALIDAIGEVTLESENAIAAARTAYDALTDAQKALVTKLSVLTAAEAKLQELKNESGSGTGNTGTGESDKKTISVTMRLIGAELASKDVDLGETPAYLPNYVTWIPTTEYELDEGATVYDLWILATEEAGIRSVGAEKNYVSTVYAPSGYALSEFTNGRRSGWMYTIDGRHPGYGLKEQALHDGDVVIWHYINDYSYECADWFSEGQWQALGDGTYYNQWLLAPDYVGGAGGGIGDSGSGSGGSGSGSESGSGSGSGGDTTVNEPKNEAVVDVTAEVTDGEAKATVETEAVTEALENTENADVLTVKVESEEAESVELTLDAEAVKAAAEAEADLHIETEQGTVKLDTDVIGELAEAGGEVAVSVTANEDGSVTLDVTVDGESTDVTMKVELPAADEGQVLVIVNADGTEEVIKKSVVEGATAYAELPAGATVKVVENAKDFGDVSENAWYADAVDFVSSHELFEGVDEGVFAPEDNMTRAMLVTVLFRLEDEPEGFTGVKFSDVKDDTWYTDAVAWASENDIVNGNGDGFAPNDNITREQIATVLYRYARYLGMDVSAKGDVSSFGDGSEVSSWASDAMAWAVEVGLFKGDDTGSLNPQGNATRAEVATLLERLIKLIVVS